MTTITKITTDKSGLYSDVTICQEQSDGSRDGYETLRVTHAVDASATDRATDIDAAVATAAATAADAL